MAYEATSENNLLDYVRECLKLSTDKQLAAVLKITTCNLSRVRHGSLKFGPSYKYKVLEATGWTAGYLRQLLEGQCKGT